METTEQQSGSAEDAGSEASRPVFIIGQHASIRQEPLNELQYGRILNLGMSFVTTPITNGHFRNRVFKLAADHLAELKRLGQEPTATATPLLADPIIPPLTPKDTGLFPSQSTSTFTAWVSPWIDLGSPNSVVAAISRQVLNLEIAYASFCGIPSVVVPGPGSTSPRNWHQLDISQYARAIQEIVSINGRPSIILHIPMCISDNPGLDETETLSGALKDNISQGIAREPDDDGLSSWDAWNQIRSFCNYSMGLYAGLQVPKNIPNKALVNRWFSEPTYLLILGPHTFQPNKSGYPSLPKTHQQMIFRYMRLQHPPWILLCDLGPEVSDMPQNGPAPTAPALTDENFPALSMASSEPTRRKSRTVDGSGKNAQSYISYLRWIETQQDPISFIDEKLLTGFKDRLQSPLQPLSDNLESVTYEVFEGDPVKYNQYESAITEALAEWKQKQTPTSSESGEVVMAVAGSGRGPLVTRALRASERTGVPVQIWAVEKNPNAYVYLLRQNELHWQKQVHVVKTDMRTWKGPLLSPSPGGDMVYGKVDILVSELLGSFGDNELSPECLDGIQHVIARPHGISIPKSYTAHLSPISTPRIYADLLNRISVEPDAFQTPWVVKLWQMDLISQQVPGHDRFQQAWKFSHPVPETTLKLIEERRSGGVVGGVGGSMTGASGVNDHNSRYCQLTFVCPARGVVHGLAGYFEATLYERSSGDEQKVELSILPNMIDVKSKDMISWFPIFFPLKKPLLFPNNAELDVRMWRQTDDSKVWYEWTVDVYVSVGSTQRLKVGSSELCSSRKVACLL